MLAFVFPLDFPLLLALPLVRFPKQTRKDLAHRSGESPDESHGGLGGLQGSLPPGGSMGHERLRVAPEGLESLFFWGGWVGGCIDWLVCSGKYLLMAMG